ncbi:MAG: hypothetical protein EA370_06705, partial [Wenzhouxiangella sp.]
MSTLASSDRSCANVIPQIICRPDRYGRLDSVWLAAVRKSFPDAQLFARPAQAGDHDLASLPSERASLTSLLAAMPNRDRNPVLVLASGVFPAPNMLERLAGMLNHPGCPDLTWLPNNRDADLNPAAGLNEDDVPDALDSLVAACGAQCWTRFQRQDGSALLLRAGVDMAGRDLNEIEQAVVDTMCLHDPSLPRNHGKSGTPIQQAAFGQVRQRLQSLLQEQVDSLAYIGFDPRPVTLHITHAWGGGIARWIRDQCEHDEQGLHLVLTAAGEPDGQEHGQRLCLYAHGPDRTRLAEWVLEPPIADTASRHAHYAELLDAVLARYRVSRVLVSSLIGHSLDCLRTGLPTGQVLHDFYPASPVLDIDPQRFVDEGIGFDVAAALSGAGRAFQFANRSVSHWQHVRASWLETVIEQGTRLIAPTRHVAARWSHLFPGSLDGRIEVIAHGQPPSNHEMQ